MYRIINAYEYCEGIEAAARYIHGKWGRPTNFPFYLDAVKNSSVDATHLPVFYLIMKDNEICGCSALIVNDFISRHDLYPWFACVFVEKEHRGQKLGSMMMDRGAQDAKKIGFEKMYLTTDLDGYYERYEWVRIEDGYELDGSPTRIYERNL